MLRHFTSLRIFPFLSALLAQGCGSESTDNRVVGSLEWDRVELIAEASEPIVELLAREGETVAPGQILLRLDPQRRQALLDEAIAARAQASARLLELEQGPRAEDIAQAEAKLQGSEQVHAAKMREYARQEELLRRRLASPDTADQSRAARDAAQAERDANREALRELRAGTRPEQLEQARQALAQAEAAVRRAEVDLARLTVRAPVPSRVDSLPFKLGNQPQAGKVVAVLLSGEAPYARVYIPEPIRAWVRPGDSARIRVDGLPDALDGVVRSVESDPAFTPFYALTERDRRHLSYVAKIDLKGEVRQLPAGLPVEAELPGALPRPERKPAGSAP